MIELTKLNKAHHLDWMQNGLPDKSVQLIIADPPYFEVKGDFDFVWKSFDDYLKDVERWAVECKRVLADNGTLFWWGNSKKIAYAQIILDKYFNLENSIVWEKVDSIQMTLGSVDVNRSFTTHNERLLMYSNEWDVTGLEAIMEEHIRPKHPFAIYLRDEFKRAGVTNKSIAALFPSATGGLTGCVSNWLNGENVITEEQYNIIRKHLNGDFLRKEYEELRKEYEELRKEYEELRKEYEELRRPFRNTMKLTEVFKFSQEGHVSKHFDHDTVKPEKLTRALIMTCSRPNDIVLVPFAGSGTECAMSEKEGRKWIGFDVNEKYVNMTNARAEVIRKNPTLF